MAGHALHDLRRTALPGRSVSILIDVHGLFACSLCVATCCAAFAVA